MGVGTADTTHMNADRREDGVGGLDLADVDDATLVEQCLVGDETAWPWLVRRYGRLVEAVIRRYHLSPDDHADVFQDVWVELWRDLGSVRERDRLKPWLVTVAGRLAWDARKRLRPQTDGEAGELLLERLVDESADPERDAARKEMAEHIRLALDMVSPRCRELISALFFEEATSYTEIAARLGCAPNSIGPIRGRCFSELRDALLAIRGESDPGGHPGGGHHGR